MLPMRESLQSLRYRQTKNEGVGKYCSCGRVAQSFSTLCSLDGLQHARFPRPSPSPGVCSNSCALSQWCHPTISPSVIPFSSYLQTFPASGAFPITRIRWPKSKSFSLIISPSNGYSRLISFWIDQFDLLAVQGTLKSLLQHYSSKASILWCSAFFMVQLSHSYMSTGKIIALTIRTFVGKVMSVLFNILSKFVIAFLPRSMRLLISWLQSPSAVILEPKKIKSVTVFTFPPSICHEVVGLDATFLGFFNVEFQASFALSLFTCIKRLFSS